MGRDSSDRDEFVDITYDQLVCQTDQAFKVVVDGEEVWVGKSKVHNVDALEAELAKPPQKRTESGTIAVPRWLAEANGWEE